MKRACDEPVRLCRGLVRRLSAPAFSQQFAACKSEWNPGLARSHVEISWHKRVDAPRSPQAVSHRVSRESRRTGGRARPPRGKEFSQTSDRNQGVLRSTCGTLLRAGRPRASLSRAGLGRGCRRHWVPRHNEPIVQGLHVKRVQCSTASRKAGTVLHVKRSKSGPDRGAAPPPQSQLVLNHILRGRVDSAGDNTCRIGERSDRCAHPQRRRKGVKLQVTAPTYARIGRGFRALQRRVRAPVDVR